MSRNYSLSPSKLGLLRDCARCFYDANVLKIERPRGIFPSLPGGVDRVMKDVMDAVRPSLPAHLQRFPQLKDAHFWGSVEQINKLRHWKSGLKAEVKVGATVVSLIGALDDLLVHDGGTYSPFDTKTKGDVPKDDGSQYYGAQMDIYALFLRENGMPPSGRAYLNYWYPVSMAETAGEALMAWDNVLYELTADPERAIGLVAKAVKVLEGEQPEAYPGCEFCRFAQTRVDAALAVVAKG